ncbi:MAG TPA: RAMP superfamily CRISPR-associated protein [Thermoflexus sp.]|nr:RAMP superfamily CRISPR-associated protein [Thermoflexus sp.]
MADRWRVVLEAETLTAFHTLGPGRTLPLVDRALQVDVEGNPFIPASSVRGRVRAHLERLLRASGLPACWPPRPEQMCPHVGVVPDPKEPFCLACRIFGSPWYPSPTFFEDLRLVAVGHPNGRLAYRTGIGISRRLGTVQAERLFTTESTSPTGLRFRGNIEGALAREEMGWLLAALRTVQHLGGDKARGMGQIRLRVVELLRWNAGTGAWTPENPEDLLKEVIGRALGESGG